MRAHVAFRADVKAQFGATYPCADVTVVRAKELDVPAQTEDAMTAEGFRATGCGHVAAYRCRYVRGDRGTVAQCTAEDH